MDRPSPKILILIGADPMKSPRAVEALRVALGLGSHNEGRDLSIVLSGRAPYLLAEDTSDIADAEILEKHLPVFLEWGTLFAITPDTDVPLRYVQGVKTTPISYPQLVELIFQVERVIAW